MAGLDYAPACIEADYVFPAGRNLVRVDLVAFSNEHRKDLATSCIAVQFCRDKKEIDAHQQNLPHTAAPLAILPTPTSVIIQPQSSRKGGMLPRQEHSYDDFTGYVNRNRYSFLPTTLQAVKREGRQLTLFEIDPSLYKYASEVSKKELVRRFEEAIRYAIDHVTRMHKGQQREIDLYTKHIVMVAIRILAARTLEDKRLVPHDVQATDAEALLRKAAGKFPGYFKWGDIARIGNTALGRQTADIILESLGKDYTYRAISSEQLGYFYEHTFVSKEIREELGIYYTPQKIAKEMLKALPIEEIPPERRYVLDGTCGSGGLLTAAYERLLWLLPKAWEETKKHNFLVERLHGIDKDPFNVEIAKKSLLLASLPFGDSWNIEERNFLEYDSSKAGSTPRIIVANPPFKEKREDVLEQKATKFLDRYLGMLADGGLIAIVLPESYLQNKSCRDSRKHLLANTEMLEMWQLPEGAFPGAQYGTVIICARKTAEKASQSIRFKRLFGKGGLREAAYEGIKFDVSYVSTVADRWVKDTECEMNTSFLQDIWDKLEGFEKVGDFFKVRNGIIRGKAVDLSGVQHFESEGLYKYVGSAEQLEPFAIRWKKTPDAAPAYKYPGNLQWPRTDMAETFKRKNVKVIANSGMAPTSRWRLRAAVDREGFFVSQGMYILFAKEGAAVDLEVLAAVLNSHVANAFIDSFARKRWITEKTIEGIPIPRLSDRQKEDIIVAVRAIENATKTIGREDNLSSEKEIIVRKSMSMIDAILLDAYGLSDTEQERLLNFLKAAPEEKERPTLSSGTMDLGKVTGRIYWVNSITQTMQVWILGYGNTTEPEILKISDNLPGWALRGNVDFEATILLDRGRKPDSVRDMSFLEFKLLRNAYLTDTEIDDMFKIREGEQ